jgi:hypothetical protein
MTEERKTRKQLREEADAKKAKRADTDKLKTDLDAIIHAIDDALNA